MKEFLLSPYLIYPLLIAGVISNEYYAIEWTGNLAVFFIYMLCIFTFFALFIDSKYLFSKAENNSIKMILSGLLLFVMIFAGWIITAIVFGFLWVLLLIKKQIYTDELKEANSHKSTRRISSRPR
jgi:hypothetical protein